MERDVAEGTGQDVNGKKGNGREVVKARGRQERARGWKCVVGRDDEEDGRGRNGREGAGREGECKGRQHNERNGKG